MEKLENHGIIDLKVDLRLDVRCWYMHDMRDIVCGGIWWIWFGQLRRHSVALQRSYRWCLGILLALAKCRWSQSSSTNMQCLRWRCLEQHPWFHFSNPNSCKDSSRNAASEATHKAADFSRPVAWVKASWQLLQKDLRCRMICCDRFARVCYCLFSLTHNADSGKIHSTVGYCWLCISGWRAPSSLWGWRRFAEWFLQLSWFLIQTYLYTIWLFNNIAMENL